MTVAKPKAMAATAATMESCCTCATLLSENNSRFNTYCPYCQISLTDTVLPPGLKDPPSYTTAAASSSKTGAVAPPPPYTPSSQHRLLDPLDEKSVPFPEDEEPAEDVLHFLDHAQGDSITSLSLRYGVPASVLRRANYITSDHLILGRRTVVIPGAYCKGGVSLSPRPVEGEEEEARKGKVRRWMVACKVHEYDVAVLYLEQTNYDLEAAMDAYLADEEWERKHPVEAAGRGKGIVRGGGRSSMRGVPRR
ncbi:Uu.00g057810.m01.CDS01 [Anthostomella pinea]|uniref:Uu.00g057810.m01.CDS01 n=1 Tax=Anthostomella pinea TaxID=933095 RepID=A0AAI8VRP6_9PEZI|nr:Uu.00g057810.m01.CDS01 [Anthostomella pinea]